MCAAFKGRTHDCTPTKCQRSSESPCHAGAVHTCTLSQKPSSSGPFRLSQTCFKIVLKGNRRLECPGSASVRVMARLSVRFFTNRAATPVTRRWIENPSRQRLLASDHRGFRPSAVAPLTVSLQQSKYSPERRLAPCEADVRSMEAKLCGS